MWTVFSLLGFFLVYLVFFLYFVVTLFFFQTLILYTPIDNAPVSLVFVFFFAFFTYFRFFTRRSLARSVNCTLIVYLYVTLHSLSFFGLNYLYIRFNYLLLKFWSNFPAKYVVQRKIRTLFVTWTPASIRLPYIRKLK